MTKKPFLILYLAFVVCLASSAFAAAQRNLALNKKVDFDPKPNHYLVAHPNDVSKMTDGIKGKCLWYQDYRDKTVGWEGTEWVHMIVDLGQPCDVGQVRLYTVGGGANGVEYPEFAIAAVSLDGKKYVLAEMQSTDSWQFGGNGAEPKAVEISVQKPARYVMLIIRPTLWTFFADEIEIIEAQRLRGDFLSSQFLSKEQMMDCAERIRQLQRDMGLFKQFLSSRQDVQPLAWDKSSQIESAIAELSSNPNPKKVSEIETQWAIVRAVVLKAQFGGDWLLCPADIMDVMRFGDMPSRVSDDFQIELYQWRNEKSAAAVCLTNCSDEPLVFTVNFSPLRTDDHTIDSNSVFELRRAVYIRVRNAGLVADPLVLQNSKPFTVPAGQTVQLWLEADARMLPAGAYAAAMVVAAPNSQKTIQIKMDVADKQFLEPVPFYACNWDYAADGGRFTSQNHQFAIADLTSHYINVAVILPRDIFESESSGKVASAAIRSELALRKGISNKIVLACLGGTGHLERRFGKFGTSGFEIGFSRFLEELREAMFKNGLDYNSFVLYPYDEDIGERFMYVARQIRQLDPKLKIYANKWIESEMQFKQVRDLIDIWCPHLPEVLANTPVFRKYQNAGHFDYIWCYHANIAKMRFFADTKTAIGRQWRGGPNGMAFRTMPIIAEYLGMTGAGFWVYLDSNGGDWLGTNSDQHGVIYQGAKCPDKECLPEFIVPSKRWQQWRQGVEDAVCLMGHQDLLDEFFQTPNSKLTSDYLTSLRKRADKKNN